MYLGGVLVVVLPMDWVGQINSMGKGFVISFIAFLKFTYNTLFQVKINQNYIHVYLFHPSFNKFFKKRSIHLDDLISFEITSNTIKNG